MYAAFEDAIKLYRRSVSKSRNDIYMLEIHQPYPTYLTGQTIVNDKYILSSHGNIYNYVFDYLQSGSFYLEYL